MSKLALQLIAENKAKHERGEDARYLDLGNCGLSTLPAAIRELTWLETLILSNEWEEYNLEKKQWERKPSQNKAPKNNIQSIAGVEHLKALKNLVVANANEYNSEKQNNWGLNDLSPLAGLVDLQQLYCYSTQISDLSPLAKLTDLQHLFCHNTEVSDLSPLTGLTDLQQLSCSNTQVNNLSPLAGLTNLQQLICYNTQVSDLSPLAGLMGLQQLSCHNTQVSDLSPLAGLMDLQQLYCSNTQVNDLSPLASLTALQELYCHNTQVSDLSPLAGLTDLQHLFCSSTQVSDLSPLAGLTDLQQLDCNNTQVSDLSPLAGLTNLQILNCSNTQVSDLSPLSDLHTLRFLDISYTKIYSIFPIMRLREELKIHSDWSKISEKELKIWKNKEIDIIEYLSEINDDNKKILTHAQASKALSLDLSGRHLNKIPDEVFDFYWLETLDLSNNFIKEIPEKINHLQQIKKINLKENPIEVISLKIENLKYLIEYTVEIENIKIKKNECVKNQQYEKAAYLRDLESKKSQEGGFFYDTNSLVFPPKEIADNGINAILSYFNQVISQGGTEIINEAKLIIVGEGKTGKTTLFNKLIDPDFDLEACPTDETHGINIHEGLVLKDDFRANLWDFGGQELQYMTHQFFLTPKALYVLLMEARAEAPNLAYWFKIISLLGKDRSDEKVSLLLVLNKRKGSTGVPQYQDLLKLYEEDFDYQFLEVDFSDNDKRWESLTEAITKRLFELPIVKNALPKQWKPIREALREEGKTRNYITTDRLHEICSGYGVTVEAEQWQMTDYLHQLGSLLHFQNDPDLMDLVILRPEWAVEGVYTTLKSDLIKEVQKGKFSAQDIFHILRAKSYSNTDSQKILKLMSKNNFDICYESENKDHYVAAQLLPDNAPAYPWFPQEVLQFRFQYPMMPKGLMSRLIVRLSDAIEINPETSEEVVWKKGVVLDIRSAEGECRVRLREDDAESKSGLRQITIEVMGDRDARKYALRRVRDCVEDLHNRWFRNIKVDEMVPCCCLECSVSATPQLFKLDNLLKRRLKRPDTSCDASGEDLMIQALLEGVYDKREIQAFPQYAAGVHIQNYHQHGGQANLADEIHKINEP